MVSWAYSPYRRDLSAPGDRRRFCFWAEQRGVEYEVVGRDADADVVVLSARADISHWVRVPRGRTKIVYDLVDSYLAVPSRDLRRALRGVAKFAIGETRRVVLDYHRGIERMCARADAVVCATEEQRAMIGAHNNNVHIVLDALGELRGPPKTSFARVDETELQIVWEGLPDTLPGLRVAVDALEQLRAEVPVHLHVVSALQHHRWAGRVGRVSTADIVDRLFRPSTLHEWTVRSLPTVAKGCDLAVIPLDLADPFSRGKPPNKLLSFWHMGVPTVASATPAYVREMDAAGVQDTCVTSDDWLTRLRVVANDEQARRTSATAGHAHVVQAHGDASVIAGWDDVFRSIGAA